jgi:alkylated DNA repair dioxygenase AlkB
MVPQQPPFAPSDLLPVPALLAANASDAYYPGRADRTTTRPARHRCDHRGCRRPGGAARRLIREPALVRLPLASGAWLDHEAAWLSQDEAAAALAALRDELTWEQREIVLFRRPILQPRLIAWAGEHGYRYSGQTLEPRPFTPTAARLLARVGAHAGVVFNHVLANRYRSGHDSMGLHADDEPELGPDPLVAILSLGAVRRLVVRSRRKGDGRRHDLELGNGALLLMGGTFQRHYVHGVPRQAGADGERISLTFRRLLRAP